MFFNSFQAQDISNIQKKTCPSYKSNEENKIQVSCDGVSECKSNSISVDVYSTKHTQCQVVYPHTLVRPIRKKSVDNKEQLIQFLKDVSEVDCNWISHFIADNLKRANARDALNHAARFACEYCFICGWSIEIKKKEGEQDRKILETEKKIVLEKIQNLKDAPSSSNSNKQSEMNDLYDIVKKIDKKIKDTKSRKSHIVWPASTIDGEPRTCEKILRITEGIENGTISREEAKGILGRSPLLMLERFDMVRDSPTEYLHSVCLGVVKRLIELTFSVGEKRPSLTQRQLASPKDFNELMLKIKVVREFSRRVRELDFAIMKGQEFRNIILFFFPVVINCIKNSEKEKKVWLLLAYMIRACILPTDEFHCVDLQNLLNSCRQFYELYESLYGQLNCSYNTHIVGSHLIEMRAHGPLTFTSAFIFESFYGELRRSFVPGTPSTLKQILQKVMVKRALTPHHCESKIFYSDYSTEMECNNLIYSFQNRTHNMYQIVSKTKDEIKCRKLGKYEYKSPHVSNLNWSKVGVYQRGALSSEIEVIREKDIHGKLIQVDNLLLTCPNNVLREK